MSTNQTMKENIPDTHYKCAECGGVFEKGWSDEEAQAERDKNFPHLPDEIMVVVCDDCFEEP